MSNREIKFRVWNESEKKYFIPFAGARLDLGLRYFETHIKCAYPEQFTGLKDKNGKEIFEGDIISYPDETNMTVSFSDTFASFILNKKGWMFGHYFGEAVNPEKCEVIGNIYENPEILK